MRLRYPLKMNGMQLRSYGASEPQRNQKRSKSLEGFEEGEQLLDSWAVTKEEILTLKEEQKQNFASESVEAERLPGLHTPLLTIILNKFLEVLFIA